MLTSSQSSFLDCSFIIISFSFSLYSAWKSTARQIQTNPMFHVFTFTADATFRFSRCVLELNFKFCSNSKCTYWASVHTQFPSSACPWPNLNNSTCKLTRLVLWTYPWPAKCKNSICMQHVMKLKHITSQSLTSTLTSTPSGPAGPGSPGRPGPPCGTEKREVVQFQLFTQMFNCC